MIPTVKSVKKIKTYDRFPRQGFEAYVFVITDIYIN